MKLAVKCWQFFKNSMRPDKIAVRHCRRTKPGLIRLFNGASNATLSLNLGPVGNRNVAHKTNLPTNAAIAPDLGTASYPCLGSNYRMRPNINVVTYLYQVIQFHPFTNPGHPDSGPVDHGIGTNIFVILQDHLPDLRYFLVKPLGVRCKAKTITSYNNVGMKDTMFTNFGLVHDSYTWINNGAGTNLNLRTNVDLVEDHHVRANICSSFDGRKTAHRHGISQPGCGVDRSKRRNTLRTSLDGLVVECQ